MPEMLLIFLCLTIGFALHKYKIVPVETAKILGTLLIYVFIPAVILFQFDKMVLDTQMYWVIFPPWAIYVCSILFFNLVDYCKPFANKKTKGVLILTSGIGSISFVGYPIFESIYGHQGLVAGIIMSQAGTVLCASTLGIATAAWYAGKKVSTKFIVLQVVKFPPTIAFIIAIVLKINQIHLPENCSPILQKISAAFQPIALLTIGLQMSFSITKREFEQLKIGFIYKLLIAPILIFMCFLCVGNTHSMVAHVSILGAAIGSMNTTAIIAQRYDLETPLANKMVGLTIPISFVFVYLIHLILQSF